MRFIPYFLYLLLIGMHQVIWHDMTSIYGAAINLAALMVLGVALYKSEVIACWFGFAAGIVLAAGFPNVMGWHALTLAALGLIAYHVKERLNLESFYTKLLLMFVGILLHNILASVIQSDRYFYQLWLNALTGAIYTTVISLIFFFFKEGVITAKKIKSIF